MSHKGPRLWMQVLLDDPVQFDAAFVRFCSKIKLDEFTGCWEFAGYPNKKGYKNFAVRLSPGNWAYTTAHSAAYVLMVGPIPDGKQIDHTCENTGCVNPEHQRPLTNRENTMKSRGPEKAGQHNSRKTHCPRGHRYTEESTYLTVRERGAISRTCKTCRAPKISEGAPLSEKHNNN